MKRLFSLLWSSVPAVYLVLATLILIFRPHALELDYQVVGLFLVCSAAVVSIVGVLRNRRGNFSVFLSAVSGLIFIFVLAPSWVLLASKMNFDFMITTIPFLGIIIVGVVLQAYVSYFWIYRRKRGD